MMGSDFSFWSEDIWLPPNITWKSFDGDERFAQFSHLYYPIPAAFAVIAIRMLIERKIFRPLGLTLGLKDSVTPVQREKVLNTNHELNNKTSYTKKSLIKRKRKKLSTLDKFCETGWRWTFYFSVHIMGISIMWSKPWTWSMLYCWWDYPNHHMDQGIWWYYMVELSFYWSLLITQFFDVKRKDFLEMFIHHLATISLMVLSWTCHLHRIGSVVLLLHDFADHWLELAKLGRYTKYQKLCDTCFVMFSLTWVYTRLAYFPTIVIFSTSLEAGQILQMFPAYYVFNFLLTLLLILHLIWGYFILKVAYKALTVEDVVGDTRSQDEDEE